jgi:hypothetical protein
MDAYWVRNGACVCVCMFGSCARIWTDFDDRVCMNRVYYKWFLCGDAVTRAGGSQVTCITCFLRLRAKQERPGACMHVWMTA